MQHDVAGTGALATGLVGWTVSRTEGGCRPSPGLDAASHETCGGHGRVAALADGSVLLLEPHEIRFAEADRHSVWLATDYGRFRAATKGIDNLERELAHHGFARVHRSFLVNPERVRRVDHRGHGMITLSTDHRRGEGIPVSRRFTREVRALFGV
jgi:sigma-54 dependent transcriptional regulator, acetoin dehydrogenase operon transcriptional activator AcoR